MADRTSPAALRASLSTLRGYLSDLAGSSFEEAPTKLRLFVNYFQKDDVVRYLADRLHVRLRDVQRAALASKLELPEDPIDRVAFIYEIIFMLKQGARLDLREFLSRAFAGTTIEAKWDDFRARWLGSLGEGLGEVSDRAAGLLGDEPVDPEEVFALVLHSGFADLVSKEKGVEDGEDEPRPSPPAETPSGLAAAVARLPEARRGDLETDLEILALERSKKRPRSERLEEIVGSFAAVSPELGALARKEAALSGKLPASKKPRARSTASRKPKARAKLAPKKLGKKRKR